MTKKSETARGFLKHAQEFFVAADLVLKNQKRGVVSLPAYFLLGRSVELALKAFLLHDEFPIAVLKKKYGHDLRTLLKDAREHGLDHHVPMDQVEASYIWVLSEDYLKKRLEYVVSGGDYSLPLIDQTRRLVRRLAYDLETLICPRP